MRLRWLNSDTGYSHFAKITKEEMPPENIIQSIAYLGVSCIGDSRDRQFDRICVVESLVRRIEFGLVNRPMHAVVYVQLGQ